MVARSLILFLVSLNVFSLQVNAEVNNEPFYYHEVIGAIYRHHDGSTVAYAYDPFKSPPIRTALNSLVERVITYAPHLKDGIAGHPQPTGKLLLFTHSHEKLFLVGDSWLSDGQHSVIIKQQDYASITNLRRKSKKPSGGLGWKKRWQQEATELLEREQQLNEWEERRAAALPKDSIPDLRPRLDLRGGLNDTLTIEENFDSQPNLSLETDHPSANTDVASTENNLITDTIDKRKTVQQEAQQIFSSTQESHLPTQKPHDIDAIDATSPHDKKHFIRYLIGVIILFSCIFAVYKTIRSNP